MCEFALSADKLYVLIRGIDWNYCVLDEGHVIKNTKTKVRMCVCVIVCNCVCVCMKITKAVKQLHANHRLILSGTPIQVRAWSDGVGVVR